LLDQLNFHILLSAVQSVAITSYNVGYTQVFHAIYDNMPHRTRTFNKPYVWLIHLLHCTFSLYLKITWVHQEE